MSIQIIPTKQNPPKSTCPLSGCRAALTSKGCGRNRNMVLFLAECDENGGSISTSGLSHAHQELSNLWWTDVKAARSGLWIEGRLLWRRDCPRWCKLRDCWCNAAGADTLGKTQIPDTSALSYDNTIKGKALQVELTCSQVLSVLWVYLHVIVYRHPSQADIIFGLARPAPGRTILRFLSSIITSGSGECCRVVPEYFDCYQTLLVRGGYGTMVCHHIVLLWKS